MEQYRILQVRAIYKSGTKSGTKTGIKINLIVDDLEEFKSNMFKLTGADDVELTYESVDASEYKEEEEIMI